MKEIDKKVNLSTLIDIKFLQEFQDTFAEIMDVASVTVDNNGPITKPSKFTDFCRNHTTGTEIGLLKWDECCLKWSKIAAEKGAPVVYTCDTGLTDFIVPIMVDGQHVGSILGGQVLTEEPNEEHFRQIARTLTIDEDEYINSLGKFKIIPIEKIEAVANLLHLVVNGISEINHKNQELLEKEKIDNLYKAIMETIRGSLDIDATKQAIVEIVGKALNADRCFIIEYDKLSDDFLVINDEYLSSSEITGYTGIDINNDIPEFAAVLKKGKSVIINNKENCTEAYSQNYDIEINASEQYNVNSAFAFPLYYLNELIGALAIHYVDKKHCISNDEINITNLIADQIAIVIHHAKLYKTTQILAEKEKINKNIIEILRSTLDKKTIIHLFVQNIGKYFKADRVFFSDYDAVTKSFSWVVEGAEYLSSNKEKSFVKLDLSNASVQEYIKLLSEKKELKIPNWDEYMQANQNNLDLLTFFEGANIKSSYSIPVTYQQTLLGSICIDFTQKNRILSDEEINSIRNMCTQCGIALYHAELYHKAQDLVQSKAEFITKMSHNLKTPLNIITGFSEILSKSEIHHDKLIEYLGGVNSSAEQVLDLTNYIINISKEEAKNSD